jgi:hypothetical protein
MHVCSARLARVDDWVVCTLVIEGAEHLPLGITFIRGVMSHRPARQQRQKQGGHNSQCREQF